jgi:ABC-type glycerol-3-phosphate transport system substrate-binding protein
VGNEINVLYFKGLPEGQRIQDNIAPFEHETGYTVRYSEAPYDDIRRRQLKSFSQHTAEYDVVFVDDIWMYEYARKGFILDLTDLVNHDKDRGEQYELADVSPKVAAAEAYLDDRVWLIPQRADVQVLFYNKQILANDAVRARYKSMTGQDLAVPTTWSQYHDVARAAHGVVMNGPTLVGTAETFKQPHFAFEFFATRSWSISGLDFLEPATGRPIFASPGGVKALQYVCSLQDVWFPGSTIAGHDESIAAFSTGAVALMPQWFAFYAILSKPGSQIKDSLGVALMPGEQTIDTGLRRFPSIGGGSLGISANSKNVDASWAFIKYMTSPKFMRDAAMNGEIVTRTSAYSDPQVHNRNPAVDVYLQSLDISKYRPRSVSYAAIESAIGEGVSKALSGSTTPFSALTEAAAAVVQLNQQNGV